MRQFRVLIIGMFGLLAQIVGCRQEHVVNKPVTPVAEAPAAEKPSVESVPPTIAGTKTESPESKGGEEKSAVESTTGSASEKKVTATATAAEARAEKNQTATKPVAPERILLLTPHGPLLVDVRITLGDQPHSEAFAAVVERVLEAGDTDKDGQPTWKELLANQEYAAQSPGMPAQGGGQMKTFLERYDERRDGKIQPEEVASWLGRDGGTSARPLNLRSSRAYSPAPRATSRVWQLLDADRDGRLDQSELNAAAARLWSLDGDDDRAITPAELASLREQLEAAARMASGMSYESRYAALHLVPDYDIERLEYLLSDLYAPRQSLTSASFTGLGELFTRLDANKDDWLERTELAEIMTTPAHLELAIAFTDSKPPTATLKVDKHASELEILEQPSTDRVLLSLAGTRIIISANDLSAAPPETPNPQQAFAAELLRAQTRAMIHDQCDALFEEIDANADGRLGEHEIETCAARLLARDANADGQLAGDEVPYSMIVAFLRAEPANQQSFFIPSMSTTVATDSKIPAWFQHADFNGDGDVSRREFLGSAKQFDELDGDRNGYINAMEAGVVVEPGANSQ